jgi:teichoic acid transport system permease protein
MSKLLVLLFKMSKEDYLKQFRGALFGSYWSMVQPIVLTVLWCLVFGLGLKAAPVNDHPFAPWLICGIAPYFYFSEVLSRGVNSFSEYSYLVKKVVFPVKTIPLIKLLSSTLPHVFFILLSLLTLLIYGYSLALDVFGVFFYFICLVWVTIPILFFVSILNVFLKDVSHILSVILQVLVWVTPVFWQREMLPDSLSFIALFNPLSYVVTGYRSSLLGIHLFDQTFLFESGIFFLIGVLLYSLAYFVYRKLRPELADYL